MGETKYVGVPTDHTSSGPLEVEPSVPIVPVATALDTSMLEGGGPPLPTAMKIDAQGNGKMPHEEEREDGVTITWEKGEIQPAEFRDKWFAVAFITHLVGVLGTGIAFGPAAWNQIIASSEESGSNDYDFDDESSTTTDTQDAPPPKEFWFAVVAIALVTAPALSFLALTIMSRNAIGLIKASLWFSVVLCGLSAFLLLAAAPPAGFIYAIFTVCLIWYARSVQSRIPFAASNLKAGITVLKQNLGLGLVALGCMSTLLLYCFGWTVAFLGTMQLPVMMDSSSADQQDLSAVGGVVGFLFLLSFYWSHQVLKNVARATVSGVVGTWWFSPAEAGAFCSSAVSSSFIRSTTYSFGSICFGSLIVAILHMVRNSLRRAQNDRNAGILACVAMCILSWIERLVEYFNKWAYVYVGLYGYNYIEAGKRVINLFKTRGWSTVITDNLVNRLLGIMSLTIGLLCGVCTLFAAFLVEEFEAQQGWLGIAFVVGFVIGLVLSGVFMGLLSSAVDAIIVCYAEAPKELEENHSTIAAEMSVTWAEAGIISGPVIVGLGGGLGVV